MGILLGNSCIYQPPFCPPLPPPRLPTHSRRNVKKMVPFATLRHRNPGDCDVMERRPFLFLSFSILPFLQSRAGAVEGPVKDEQDKASVEQLQQRAPANPFLGFLNGIGIVGSGVLGALYALSRNEMATLKSTIELMRSELNDKEKAMDILENNFRRSLQKEHEEKVEQIRKIKEEQATLSSKLASANFALAKLQQELHDEKESAQDLKVQADHLRSTIAQAEEDRETLKAKLKEKHDATEILQERLNLVILEIKDKETSIENLYASLSRMQSDCQHTTSMYNQAKEDLAQAHATVKQLNEQILKRDNELELRKSSEEDLSSRLSLLLAEKDEAYRNIQSLEEKLAELKSMSDKRAAYDSEILASKDFHLNQLKEELETALNDARSHEEYITELSKERDAVRTNLEKEKSIVEDFRCELQNTQETLRATKLQVVELSEQLKNSERSCEELRSELSRIQTEYSEALSSLNHNMDELKSSSKIQSDELVSVKESLHKAKDELLFATEELRGASEARENLEKELSEIFTKAEMAENDLKEERKVVAILNKELEDLRKQILEDKKAQRDLERDLEAATKSLDKMNRNALSLSRELEVSNSNGANLEMERGMLYKSLQEQKCVVKEAQENLEDANNLISKLSKERENMQAKSKRLDEELATAKGEILQLRREIHQTKTRGNEQHQQEKRKVVDGTTFVKKNSRKKVVPSSDDSE